MSEEPTTQQRCGGCDGAVSRPVEEKEREEKGRENREPGKKEKEGRGGRTGARTEIDGDVGDEGAVSWVMVQVRRCANVTTTAGASGLAGAGRQRLGGLDLDGWAGVEAARWCDEAPAGASVGGGCDGGAAGR